MANNKTHTPDGWQAVRLGDVAEVVGGSTPSRSKKEFWDGNVSWVVPSELTNLHGRYLTVTKDSITDEGMKSSGLRVIPNGSVLLTSRATIGITAINAIPVTTNQGFQNLVVKNGTDSLWLYYSISSLRNELERRAAGSTFLEVSRDSVRSLPLLLPPLPEQRAIAAVLDSIDEAIELTEAVITATERLRDALLHDLLTRGVPGWHSEWKEAPGIGTIPASWEVVRLGDVAEVVMGQSPPGETVIDWNGDSDNGDGLPFIQGNAEFGVKFPSPLKWCVQPPKVAYSDDLLISVRAPVGETNRADFELGIGRGLAAIRFNEPGRQAFGWHVVNRAKRTLERVTQGSTFEAINGGSLRALPIVLPPSPEQQAIAAMLDSMDASIDRAREERDSLQSLRVTTSDALLTGRVRVRNHNE